MENNLLTIKMFEPQGIVNQSNLMNINTNRFKFVLEGVLYFIEFYFKS
ncbi:hypothetical protein SAMN05421825_3745 [Epilithonimonas hungarica]|uniref:Uncharacterized protein n=1 Tax=Epilithonimonas hungarica TaxID=454006 RepID=A0A1G7VZR5_9FLAO|nr:hypothetical protein SAMN05421825_3745 [Epilithonimonas hungarica]